MAERGYLVIAAITGYTAFLSSSKLEHAADSLNDLPDLIIDQTKPPLVISRLEGEAVISYAPEASSASSDQVAAAATASLAEAGAD